MKGRKAALDISINSIVVIIFAITMLGLGLGFIRGTFGSIGERVGDVISSTDLEKKPTASDPLTISTSRLEMKRGDTKIIQVGYYNFEDTDQNVGLVVDCGSNPAIKLTYPTDARPFRSTDSAGWKVSITASRNALSDTYACVVKSTVGSTTKKVQDFFIIIQ
ncbi:MAG: hypothetical protein HY518_01020 [Candidatus Aenigmarchaeota archaeon]|nr:hypothetical protein [Candidatus Aenigmarchaeota archaeon]